MATNDAPAGADVAELLARARKELGSLGSFRVRVLLDMVLIELARETAEARKLPAGPPADE